ncbi:MAG: DsbA family protein [Desulfobulbaceae bacterium]|nr:DsbA family protein [Desulfobulbaceae bacterium]HIJ91505.1 thioredoxin domain-containing protein [Deltaproteobacteria bacterium]
MKKQYLVITSGLFLVFLFVLGGYFYKTQQTKKLGFLAQKQTEIFVRKHSPTLGSDKAKVFLVEFMDPACETCSAFYPFVKKLMADHPGQIKLVLRYAPFHDGADYFVRILEAASKQGKYMETLEIMYQSQPYWASHHNPQPQLVWQFLPRVGLDLEKLKNDMNDPEIDKIIAQDLADAKTLNVMKTPGFFVNGKPLVTFGDRELQQLIESEIAEQYPR